jgi:myosin heavy subunit
LENLNTADATLESLQKQMSSVSSDVVESDELHSIIDANNMDILKLDEAIDNKKICGQNIEDRLNTANENIQCFRNKVSQLKISLTESNAILHDINKNQNSNNELTTAIEESQKVVSDEKTNLLNLQSHNADVYSQIIKLNQERQHASTTVVLDQKEIDELKKEISSLQTHMKELQSGHSKFALLDETREQELTELHSAIKQEEEKYDAGPRQRQREQQQQQQLQQLQQQKQKRTNTSSNAIPSPSVAHTVASSNVAPLSCNDTPEDSDPNDFLFSSNSDFMNPKLSSFSESKAPAKIKPKAPMVGDSNKKGRLLAKGEKKQPTTSPGRSPDVISLNHANASKILRRKHIKKEKDIDKKHWLQNNDW